MGFTYRDAGVDIDEGDALVERIKPHARRTLRPEVLAGIGGGGGGVAAGPGGRRRGAGRRAPAVVRGGQSASASALAARSAKDVGVCGAEPVVFLDYFATSRLRADQAERV